MPLVTIEQKQYSIIYKPVSVFFVSLNFNFKQNLNKCSKTKCCTKIYGLTSFTVVSPEPDGAVADEGWITHRGPLTNPFMFTGSQYTGVRIILIEN